MVGRLSPHAGGTATKPTIWVAFGTGSKAWSGGLQGSWALTADTPRLNSEPIPAWKHRYMRLSSQRQKRALLSGLRRTVKGAGASIPPYEL